MPNVTLGPFNTLNITAGTVYRLVGVAGINRPLDLINLGPGTVFLRSDKDPTVTDQNSLQVPANWAINSLITDGRIGLGVIADADTKISVKVT